MPNTAMIGVTVSPETKALWTEIADKRARSLSAWAWNCMQLAYHADDGESAAENTMVRLPIGLHLRLMRRVNGDPKRMAALLREMIEAQSELI